MNNKMKELFVFESSVILEGSKTVSSILKVIPTFESSVILEGSKTLTQTAPLRA